MLGVLLMERDMNAEMPVALVTGAARRIGAVIAATLHAAGYRVVIHCRRSVNEADALAARLNAARPDSALVLCAELLDHDAIATLGEKAANAWGRLDLLVNNASSFHPTHIGATTHEQWNDLIGSNLAAPYFLVQATAPFLAASHGAIVNLVDVHAQRPLAGHAVYSTAKAGLHMLTRAQALELAPGIRVNGIAPGAILWPEAGMDAEEQRRILADIPLQRTGTPQDIADAVLFLARSEYITGQIIAVDGGRSL